MNKQLLLKIKEALVSVLPITLFVIILNFTPIINFSQKEMLVFVFSSVCLILGIGLFNLGADMAMSPMGEQVGSGLSKTKSLKIVLLVCFFMGLFITIAEPDLKVLASQVQSMINSTFLIFAVGFGVGFFIILSILKIVFKINLSSLLMFFYLVIFALISILLIQGKFNFLAISFDSGGVTTGPITVPFIMSLGIGLSSVLGGKKSKENSFGIVAMGSIGPIIAVLLLGIFSKGLLNYEIPNYLLADNLTVAIFKELLVVSKDVLIALGLIVIFFFTIQFISLKLPKKKIIQICIGILYTFIGLIIFLTAVNIGFMPIGYKLGAELANSNKTILIISSFIIGLLVVLAEPAVHVLNKQVEELTDGMISKKSLLIALSTGVGISILLSIIRIIYDFNILYYIIPGYIISLGLAFFVPKIYTAIAFDSGGVASGPLTSTFILPFAVGVCVSLQGVNSVLQDAFGIVSMVAMTPLITIQLLGFRSIVSHNIKEKIAMRKILDADDEQIIDFI